MLNEVTYVREEVFETSSVLNFWVLKEISTKWHTKFVGPRFPVEKTGSSLPVGKLSVHQNVSLWKIFPTAAAGAFGALQGR